MATMLSFLALVAALTVTVSSLEIGAARIFNGTTVPLNKYPYMVSISTRKIHFCGGTLISPGVVLTAAHCLEYLPEASSLRVRAGGVELNETSTFNVYRVARYEIHPFYVPVFTADPTSWRRVTSNDIAVIYLEGDAEQTPAKINVDPRLESDGARVSVVGWGAPGVGQGSFSNALMEAQLTAISLDSCIAKWAAVGQAVGTGTVCATDLVGSRDGCFGDSGGPLFGFGESGEPVFVGVVSAGDVRCLDRIPGIYTRVSDYHCWLESLGIPGIASPTGPCEATRFIPENNAGGSTPVEDCVESTKAVAVELAGRFACERPNITQVLNLEMKKKCREEICLDAIPRVCSRRLGSLGQDIMNRTCQIN